VLYVAIKDVNPSRLNIGRIKPIEKVPELEFLKCPIKVLE